jgi:ADP-ribose pyrophosphatase YjhB (NUDIX family)
VSAERIRVLALALIHRGTSDELLVERGRDETKDETFYRLPGGGIAFGETGEAALRRELHEELGAEISGVRYVRTVENIFTYEDRPGHEICRLYECSLQAPELYERDEWQVRERPGDATHVHDFVWVPRADFETGRATLYPDEALG